MKSKQRKTLELEAVLLGITVTYDFTSPPNPKYGDRWYHQTYHRYQIYLPSDYLKTLTAYAYQEVDYVIPGPWQSVGSKRFFDLSDIK